LAKFSEIRNFSSEIENQFVLDQPFQYSHGIHLFGKVNEKYNDQVYM
jgi:hypothetical protein